MIPDPAKAEETKIQYIENPEVWQIITEMKPLAEEKRLRNYLDAIRHDLARYEVVEPYTSGMLWWKKNYPGDVRVLTEAYNERVEEKRRTRGATPAEIKEWAQLTAEVQRTLEELQVTRENKAVNR